MAHRFKTVSVIGLGYIGLPSAAVLAAHRVKVVGVDINSDTVEIINRGNIHIVEPELDSAVNAAVSGGFLFATTTPVPANAFLVAVPTPFKDGHEPDLHHIEEVCRAIAPVLKRGDLVVLESTSPVGATEQMAAWLQESRPDLTFPQGAGEASDIRIAHCPERVLPGKVMRELIDNDRVIGGMTARCSLVAKELYEVFVRGACIVTSVRTAEMCKLAENAFRDVNIAFANELSIICGKLGIDVWELRELANRHPRVRILQPGPGVGGHCIAVDPWFIVNKTPDEARLIRVAREINDAKPAWVLDQVDQAVAEHANSATLKIACFGLTFKPDIDDMRESPSLRITLDLARRYPGRVVAVEPHVSVTPAELVSHGVPLAELAEAIETCAILVLLVDHRAFKEVEPPALKGKTVIDTRGIWSPR